MPVPWAQMRLGEVNFGFSPKFFGTDNDFGNNTLMDLMANLIVGIPIGGRCGPGFRPFALVGLGLIRTRIDGGSVFDVLQQRLRWNAGVGPARLLQRSLRTSR